MNENSEIAEHISELALIDHHVHGTLIPDLSRSEFESHLTESSEPIPPWMTQFDSQVGFAVRKYCAPHFDLPEHASADAYWAARSQWGSDEIARRLLRTSGISEFIVDTGVIQTEHSERSLTTLEEFGTLAAQRVHEVVRLETLLERLVTAGVEAGALEDAFDAALAAAATTAVGFKSIIAYRYGFDFDPTRPHRDEFTAAAQEWLTSATAGPFRVSHPVLLRALLWKAVSTGLPVQLHAGYGDADIDLERCNPLLLTPWLRLLPVDYSDVMLLHCYPYHREAGYLAQVFSRVYFDVGLAINYSGAASDRVIAESLELAPFSKVLFSTDAWGLPELHSIGAALWRRGMTRVLSHLVDDGDWSLADAKRVASMTGHDNAQRVYQLPTS